MSAYFGITIIVIGALALFAPKTHVARINKRNAKYNIPSLTERRSQKRDNQSKDN
ncbi:MAG: hypothetical protein FWE34_02315 [Defluviitaleaceae bacterium]|nr:hypothetical protein [Defluviitaleaceae bacterium]